MPPQIKFVQTLLLSNAARGHINQAGGRSIIRWACNPPPPPGLLRRRNALAKLRGSQVPMQIVQGGKSSGGRSSVSA